MSIPGTNMEHQQDDPDPIQIDPAQAAAAEAAAQEDPDDDNLIPTVQVGQQQMAPVSEVIRLRKEARAAKKEAAELKTRVERAEQVGRQLEDVMPLIETLRGLTPQQREALASGKLPSLPGTPQNAEDDEAKELAEDLGLIAADGSLDIARARRRLDKDNARYDARLQAAVAPLRQNTAQQQAGHMRERAKTIKDNNGVPIASEQSIDEAYGMLPPELAAHPNVAMVALGTAMFIDRMRGRKVTAAVDSGTGYAAPIVSEAGGRRQAPAMSAEERAALPKLGLTEKEYENASTALSRAAGSRRGVALE